VTTWLGGADPWADPLIRNRRRLVEEGLRTIGRGQILKVALRKAWRTHFCVPRRHSADARPFVKTGVEKSLDTAR
jgi:hypothetical protein